MVTDPGRIHKADAGRPEICQVFSFYKIYKDEKLKEIENRCIRGEIGCIQCKDEIAKFIFDSLKQFQEKRSEILKDVSKIYDILDKGKNKVREIAEITISDVRKKMGID